MARRQALFQFTQGKEGSSPVKFGGGVVFDTEDGLVLEFAKGAEWETMAYPRQRKLRMYVVPIPDDLYTAYSGLDLKHVASVWGLRVSDLRADMKSKDIASNALALYCIGEVLGWDGLADDVKLFSYRELARRWGTK